MNAVVQHPQSRQMVSRQDDIRTALSTSLYPGASDESINMVLAYCSAAGLDPMQKPVHIVPMWDSKAHAMRDVVMPGIGLYRIQASRSGQFAGMSEPEFGPMLTETIGNAVVTFPEWCKVTAKRQLETGTIAEFTAVEYWIENYAIKGGKEKDQSPNAMWMKRARGQLAKCAQAQALRMAFPEIGAQPTAEEMDGKEIIQDEPRVIRAEQRPQLAAYSNKKFDENLPAWRSLIESGKKTADDIIAMVETKGTLTDGQRAEIRACAVQGGAQ